MVLMVLEVSPRRRLIAVMLPAIPVETTFAQLGSVKMIILKGKVGIGLNISNVIFFLNSFKMSLSSNCPNDNYSQLMLLFVNN